MTNTLAFNVFRNLRRALLRLFLASVRVPYAVLFLWLSVLVALAFQASSTRVVLSISEVLDESFTSVADTSWLNQLFEEKTSAFLMVVPRKEDRALSKGELQLLKEWVASQREDNPDIAQIITAFDIRKHSFTPLGRLEMPVVQPQSKNGLKPLLSSPWSGILTDNMARDLGILVKFGDAEPGQRYGAYDPRVFGAMLEDLDRQVLSVSDLQVYSSGTAAFQFYSLMGIQKFQFLNLLMLLGLIIAMRMIAGTWISGVLLVGILVMAGIVVYGVMGTLGLPIDQLSTGLFLIISVAAISDFMFITGRQMSQLGSWRSNFTAFLLPSFFTSLTTFIGFASSGWPNSPIVSP
jgi:predicted RND superfamily exporter protein